MKVHIISSIPYQGYVEKLNKLGFSVSPGPSLPAPSPIPSVEKEIIEADIILCFICKDPPVQSALGIAIGDYLCRQSKDILIVGSPNELATISKKDYLKYFSTFDQVVADYFIPNSPLKKVSALADTDAGSTTEEVRQLKETVDNTKRMLKLLSLAYYPYLVIEHGEDAAIEILEEDTEKISKDIRVTLDLQDSSLKLYYQAK